MENVVLKSLGVADLIHAPWNPRTAEELSLDNPSMIELVESVRSGGINQSLAVWDRGDGEPMMVIAGNRRLEAARAAGLKNVPAIVFTGITEARAREITRTENEIRRGVDPLMDAQLIEGMLSKGLSQKTIAAHFAMSEAMVCRRTKLLGLIDEIRQLASKRHNFATDALEQIALYPPETQRECLASVKRAAGRDGETVRWSLLRYDFDRMTRKLDGAKFDTSECVKCPLRTGAQPDLWNEMPKDGELGSCLNCKCYNAKVRAYLATVVADKVGAGVPLVDALEAGFREWEIENRPEFGERKSKKTPVAWWFHESYCDEMKIFWGPTLEDFRKIRDDEERRRQEDEAKERELEESEREKRKAEEEERNRIAHERVNLSDAVDDATGAIANAWNGFDDDKLAKLVRSHVVGSAFKGKSADVMCDFVVGYFRSYSCHEEDQVRLVAAFPKFAKALKVKPAELKAYESARAALDKFDKEHSDK